MPTRMVAKREMPMVAKAGSVVRVGEGRGFIVEARDCRVGRLVVTAAHCLPYLPPAHPSSYTEERTYGELLGSLDEAPTLAAECIFVDPISDIAVIGRPDDQVLHEAAEAYDDLVEQRPSLRVAAPRPFASAWLLMLSGKWSKCTVEQPSFGGRLFITDAADGILAGMSGSPILDHAGRAIGVVSVSSAQSQGDSPSLAANLPGWLLSQLLTVRFNWRGTKS